MIGTSQETSSLHVSMNCKKEWNEGRKKWSNALPLPYHLAEGQLLEEDGFTWMEEDKE